MDRVLNSFTYPLNVTALGAIAAAVGGRGGEERAAGGGWRMEETVEGKRAQLQRIGRQIGSAFFDNNSLGQ